METTHVGVWSETEVNPTNALRKGAKTFFFFFFFLMFIFNTSMQERHDRRKTN